MNELSLIAPYNSDIRVADLTRIGFTVSCFRDYPDWMVIEPTDTESARLLQWVITGQWPDNLHLLPAKQRYAA